MKKREVHPFSCSLQLFSYVKQETPDTQKKVAPPPFPGTWRGRVPFPSRGPIALLCEARKPTKKEEGGAQPFSCFLLLLLLLFFFYVRQQLQRRTREGQDPFLPSLCSREGRPPFFPMCCLSCLTSLCLFALGKGWAALSFSWPCILIVLLGRVHLVSIIRMLINRARVWTILMLAFNDAIFF